MEYETRIYRLVICERLKYANVVYVVSKQIKLKIETVKMAHAY